MAGPGARVPALYDVLETIVWAGWQAGARERCASWCALKSGGTTCDCDTFERIGRGGGAGGPPRTEVHHHHYARGPYKFEALDAGATCALHPEAIVDGLGTCGPCVLAGTRPPPAGWSPAPPIAAVTAQSYKPEDFRRARACVSLWWCQAGSGADGMADRNDLERIVATTIAAAATAEVDGAADRILGEAVARVRKVQVAESVAWVLGVCVGELIGLREELRKRGGL